MSRAGGPLGKRPGIALVVAALGLAVTAPAGAATITVGPGCTLVSAIKSANADADTDGCTHSGAYGADTIILPFGTYALTAADNSGIDESDIAIAVKGAGGESRAVSAGANSNGLPVITSDITIRGNGSTISRPLGASPPFFRIFQVSTGGVLTLDDLTLTGGRLQDPGGTVRGGAVRVGSNGRLTLNTVTLSDNVLDASAAQDAGGGGGVATGGAVHVGESAQIRVIDAVVKNNSALASGSGSDASGGTAQGGGIYVESDAADVSVTGTTFTGNAVAANAGSGAAGGDGGVAAGAGLHVNSQRNLVLSNVNISANTASSLGGDSSPAGLEGCGGTVSGVGVDYESPSGNLTVANAVISFHTATASGGAGGGATSGRGGLVSGGGLAFQSGGSLSIADASINHNTTVARGGNGTAAGGGAGGFIEGGGVYFTGQGLVLDRVSISNNSASVVAGNGPGADAGLIEGAGLNIAQAGINPISATLSSVTLAGNSGDASSGGGAGGHAGTAQGGGLYTENSGTVTLVNGTISGNSLVPAAASDGGGIHQDAGTAAVRIQNSILAGNTAGSSPDCHGSIASLGNNIVGSTQGCTLPAVAGDRFGLAPGLGAFTDTGKPASGFFPPNPGSPALDAANSAACPPFDQLGQGRAGGCDIGAMELVPATSLVASVLPISRAGQVGGASLTAFASVINLGSTTAFKVGIAPASPIPATFHFQTTDPATNGLTGNPDTGADIGPGQLQTYVIAIRPTAAFDPVQIPFSFAGPNTAAVAPVAGLNTLLASAAVTPVADIVALAGTINANGIVDIAGPTGNGVFTVATVNLGAAGPITVRPDTGATSPAPFAFVCQTNPATAECLSPPTPTVQAVIGTNETPTFGVFVAGNGAIAFNPAVNRIAVFFVDATGVTRGATGVAVRTTP